MISKMQFNIVAFLVVCAALFAGCSKDVDYSKLDKENVMAALENADRASEIRSLTVEDDIVEIEIVDSVTKHKSSIEADEFHYLKQIKDFEDIAYVEMTYYVKDKDKYGNETEDKKVAESEIEGTEMQQIDYDELSPFSLHQVMTFTYMDPFLKD